MKKIQVTLLLCAAICMLSQCIKKTTPTKSVSAKDEVAKEKSKYTPEQLAQGKAIFQQNCSKCHEYKQPQEFSVAAWDNILPDMSQKSNLSANDAALLRAWVITNAKA